MTGMSIFGKMSVGVRRMTAGLSKRMRMARTTNVYGRLRANRTIHMDVSLLGYGAQRKILRRRACLQFLPTVSRNLNDDSYRPRFRSRSCSMHCETARSHCSYALRFMAVPLISKPCRPGMLPGHLSLQVGLRPLCPASLSSPRLNSGTASNCFSGVSGWNRRGKEFCRHESCGARNLCPIESISGCR
jgi:hypothetical protein